MTGSGRVGPGPPDHVNKRKLDTTLIRGSRPLSGTADPPRLNTGSPRLHRAAGAAGISDCSVRTGLRSPAMGQLRVCDGRRLGVAHTTIGRGLGPRGQVPGRDDGAGLVAEPLFTSPEPAPELRRPAGVRVRRRCGCAA